MEQLTEGLAHFSFSRQDISSLAATISHQPGIDHYLEALAEAIHEAEDPLSSTKEFFSAFLNCANTTQNSSFDMHDVYRQLRQNADIVPVEYREALYAGVYALEENCIPSLDNPNGYSQNAASIYWPWQWSWFGLNKQGKPKRASSFLGKASYGRYIVFSLIAISITYVAIHNPAALAVTLETLEKAALFCGVV